MNNDFLEEIYDVFNPGLPKNPDGKELTPYQIQEHSFIEGLKVGLRVAAEALL